MYASYEGLCGLVELVLVLYCYRCSDRDCVVLVSCSLVKVFAAQYQPSRSACYK